MDTPKAGKEGEKAPILLEHPLNNVLGPNCGSNDLPFPSSLNVHLFIPRSLIKGRRAREYANNASTIHEASDGRTKGGRGFFATLR